MRGKRIVTITSPASAPRRPDGPPRNRIDLPSSSRRHRTSRVLPFGSATGRCRHRRCRERRGDGHRDVFAASIAPRASLGASCAEDLRKTVRVMPPRSAEAAVAKIKPKPAEIRTYRQVDAEIRSLRIAAHAAGPRRRSRHDRTLRAFCRRRGLRTPSRSRRSALRPRLLALGRGGTSWRLRNADSIGRARCPRHEENVRRIAHQEPSSAPLMTSVTTDVSLPIWDLNGRLEARLLAKSTVAMTGAVAVVDVAL